MKVPNWKSQRNKLNKNIATKEDIIEDMKELNGKLRAKLKDLNSRMERVLDNLKFKLILEHNQKQKKPADTLSHKKQVTSAEIEIERRQLEFYTSEIEHLESKIEEATNYDQVYELRQLIDKEESNHKILNRRIRELQKSGTDNGKTLQRLNSNPFQYEAFVELSQK